MTARCAQCISYSPKFRSRLRLVPLYFARILILNEFKLLKFCLFLQEWRFGRSRSSKVIDFGDNRKRVCDFLLVRNSNLGPILHHFGDRYDSFYVLLAPPPFYRNFGVFPLHQITDVGVSQRISLKLFGREWWFRRILNPTYVSTVPVGLPEVHHRQTDAILSQYRAVHNIAREKEIIIPWIRIHDNVGTSWIVDETVQLLSIRESHLFIAAQWRHRLGIPRDTSCHVCIACSRPLRRHI